MGMRTLTVWAVPRAAGQWQLMEGVHEDGRYHERPIYSLMGENDALVWLLILNSPVVFRL